jgi:hypothetical protein
MKLTKSRTAKLVAGFVGFAMAFSFVVSNTASALSTADIQAQIAALQAQLNAVSGSTTSTGYTFNTNLTMGSKGTDVMNLQKVLNMSADTKVSSQGAGSPGMETSTFGGLTRAAVVKFQQKYGITPAAGYVGAITRAKLNSMNTGTTGGTTGTTGGTTLPTGGALTVMAGTQPANSLAPQSAARVPFTTVVLTAGSADVTVNSITVQRSGLAQDAVFTGVVLIDQNGMQIGIAKSLNSNHQAMVGEPFVIKAGTSKTVTIAGNMAADNSLKAGQVVGLDVVAINTSASVAGSLPITGAMHTINASLALGSASISSSSFDPASASSQPIGTSGYRFTGFRLTAGSAEDVTFKSIRWNQTGSAGSTDLANVVTVVNGTQYPTTVSADGKYYSTVFPSGITIAKGNSLDVYIQGDIVGSSAAGRTSEFDIYKNTDVYLVGNTYGYGVIAPVGALAVQSGSHNTVLGTVGNPWLQGSTLTVTAGSVTLISKANEVASQNIAINVPNQVLGGFATNFSGEPVSVQTLPVGFTNSGTIGGALTSVTLVDKNGAVVAGPVDATVANGTTQTVTFTDTVTFPIGRAVYTIKGKVASGASNGTTVVASTTPSSWGNVTGQTTGNSVSITTGAFAMNTMTVKGAALTVNVSAQPASQNIVGGVQNFVLANYQFDATQSGEDIRLSGMPVSINSNLSTGATITDLTGCSIWNGSTQLTTGSRVKNTVIDTTAMAFSFDNSLIVPKGTSVTLSVACNLASSPAQTSYQVLADTTTGDWSVTGVTSGNTVTPTLSSSAGGTMAVASGSMTASVDSSTPNYVTAAAGTQGVTIGTFKFRASNEDVNLTKVGLIMTSGTASDIGTVYVYQGSTLLGTVYFPQGASAVATSTLNAPLKLTKDQDVLLTVKADLAAIGSGQSGTEGKLVKIDVTNAEGSGLSSGSTLTVGGIAAGANGVRMFRSYPTVAQDTLSSTGVADGRLMRFKVTANAAGPVGIFQTVFTMATSSFSTGGGVSAVKLNVFTDSGYSQPVGGTFGAATGQFGSTATPTASAPTLTFTATTNPLQIPANTTYYFEVDATVSSVTTGTSVTTTLLGDTAYIAAAHLGTDSVSTTTGALADTNHNFIWSGNATTTAVFNANDWANGYGILNLPAGGFSQTRSQ